MKINQHVVVGKNYGENNVAIRFTGTRGHARNTALILARGYFRRFFYCLSHNSISCQQIRRSAAEIHGFLQFFIVTFRLLNNQ